MSQSAPAPVLVTEDLLPELVGKLIVMVDTEDKSGLDVPKEGKLPCKVNKKTKLIQDYIKCKEESFSLKLWT